MISFLQIASLSNSIPEVYSELCQITRMKCFANIVYGVDYFRRTLQHRYLTGFWICVASFFHDGRHYHIETAALICKSNQWTGFYIIETSLMKELSCKDSDKNDSEILQRRTLSPSPKEVIHLTRKSTLSFKRQAHKTVKHSQTIYQLLPTNCFKCVWQFCGIGAQRVKNTPFLTWKVS